MAFVGKEANNKEITKKIDNIAKEDEEILKSLNITHEETNVGRTNLKTQPTKYTISKLRSRLASHSFFNKTKYDLADKQPYTKIIAGSIVRLSSNMRNKNKTLTKICESNNCFLCKCTTQ